MNIAEIVLNDANKPKEKAPLQSMVFDGAVMDSSDAQSTFEMGALKMDVVSVIHQFAETNEDDLDEGETLSDRFLAMLCGLVDYDKDGDISDDEAKFLDIAYNIAADYFISKGAEKSDVIEFLENDDDEAGENIQELLKGILPDGEDEETDDLEDFAFGDGSDESVMDAVYKKRKVVRNGKKIIIRKRISGRVRLSSKQKLALVKAHRKAHSGKARMKRLKSMRKRQKLGL